MDGNLLEQVAEKLGVSDDEKVTEAADPISVKIKLVGSLYFFLPIYLVVSIEKCNFAA